MATVIPGIKSDGSWKVAFVTTLADPAVPKIATEISAVGSVAAECLLTKGGIGFDNSVEKFKDERLCTVDVFEQVGSTTWSMNDLEFVIDPQTPASGLNKLYALVRDGWTGYIVIRMGVSSDAAWATSDKLWVAPVAVAQAVPLPPEANSMLRAKSSVTITGTIQKDVSPVT